MRIKKKSMSRSRLKKKRLTRSRSRSRSHRVVRGGSDASKSHTPRHKLSCLRKDAPKEYNAVCKNGECSFPDEIIKNLYLGDTCSRHPQILRHLGIKNIVSANKEDKAYPAGEFINYKLNWDDATDQNLFPQIDDACEFIDSKLLNGEKVLVHCYAGISRSASVIIYYMMNRFNMSYKRALQYVKARRKVVKPNPGFSRQLKVFDKIF